jgi:hypothetical protein
MNCPARGLLGWALGAHAWLRLLRKSKARKHAKKKTSEEKKQCESAPHQQKGASGTNNKTENSQEASQ